MKHPRKDVEMQLNQMNSPCTIAEAVQIARGVAEDILSEYQSRLSHLQIAVSFQLDILKELAIETGNITEEQFRERYMQKIDEFNKLHERRTPTPEHSEEQLSMSMNTTELSIEKEKINE